MNQRFLNTQKNRLFTMVIICLFCSSSFSQWTAQLSGTNYPLQSVYFINSNTGFLASNSNDLVHLIGGEIIKTTNGGISWQRVLLDSNFRAKDFYFIDLNTGIAVGGSYSVRGYVFRTTNSGLNWLDITPTIFPSDLHNVVFPNNIIGFAGGVDGVYKTTDAGFNWAHVLSTPYNTAVWGRVYFTDINTGFYARDSGKVYRTTNSGLSWQSFTVCNCSFLFLDIKFVNGNTGFIAADTNLVFKTTDSGISWSPQSLEINPYFSFSLSFPNENTGYISGYQKILKTTNSGLNWSPVFNNSNLLFRSSFFNDVNTGYIVGDSGYVYKTTTGGVIGIKPVDPKVPVSYNLFQNYPNPFNPSTNIKFAVPKASVVNISVYDALGREIESLVNEFLQPGTYEVNWSAERFSSGIYFYKLLTSDFSMVKKMSLIK